MFLRHLALLFVASLLPCAAQGEVTLRFISFPKGLDLEPVELLIGDGKTIKIEITTNELSSPYKVPQQAFWSIGETTAGPDGKDLFKEFGRAKALASPSQLILLVRKGKKYSDGFDVISVDNRGANFGGGKFLFFNGARIDIAGELGGERFVLRPSQHTVIKPKSTAGKPTFQTVFWFRRDDEAKPFFSSVWPYSADAQSLIFFYHEPGTNYLRFHSIRSFPR